jgi:hypothetical protein
MDAVPELTGLVLLKLTVAQLQFAHPFVRESV